MKRASFVFLFMVVLLSTDALAQSDSFFTGIVTELHRRAFVVKRDEGQTVLLRVGRRTLYPNGTPAAGDRVKVEYSLTRGLYVAHSITILENKKKETAPQKKISGKEPPPSTPPPDLTDFAGKWEGFWDHIIDYSFTLTISGIHLKSEVADVRYESKDLQLTEKANVIPGEKPRLEWTINAVVKPGGPFASPSKGYFDLATESIVIYFSFEIQQDKTLKGTLDSQRMSPLGTSRKAVLRRVK